MGERAAEGRDELFFRLGALEDDGRHGRLELRTSCVHTQGERERRGARSFARLDGEPTQVGDGAEPRGPGDVHALAVGGKGLVSRDRYWLRFWDLS